MCLIVKFDREIYDDKTYTFYKCYEMVPGFPKRFKQIYQGGIQNGFNLIARRASGRPLPADGKKAYYEYADESRYDYVNGGVISYIYEGVHAYTSRAEAYDMQDPGEVIVKIEVKGKHIIAFGNEDVAFTRGKIVSVLKRRVKE